RLDQRLLKTARDNQSTYMLLTAKKEIPEESLSLWLIANPRKVKDDIQDDVLVWTESPGTRGGPQFTRDLLVARDAFVNTTYLEVKYDKYLPLTAKVKHEFYEQLGSADTGLRDQRFLGVITKGEYPVSIGRWHILSRWKQLYSSRLPASRGVLKTRDLTEIYSIRANRDINRSISFIAGAEFETFNNLRRKPDPLPPGYLLDGNTWVLAGQVANSSAYQGYALTTNVGVRWIRHDFDSSPSASELFSFITVFVGLGTGR
ncbi:uncharacterized protein METZ01_LOCUS411557, partial [marine metagenome]